MLPLNQLHVEVMTVFERPYLKKNSNEFHLDPIFGVYAYDFILIFWGFLIPQILDHLQLTQ
jgi:hypothetical protein